VVVLLTLVGVKADTNAPKNPRINTALIILAAKSKEQLLAYEYLESILGLIHERAVKDWNE